MGKLAVKTAWRPLFSLLEGCMLRWTNSSKEAVCIPKRSGISITEGILPKEILLLLFNLKPPINFQICYFQNAYQWYQINIKSDKTDYSAYQIGRASPRGTAE